jgi:hypothetical protein
MRDFTNRQIYKRVWVGGRNMVVMVAETTWAPLAGRWEMAVCAGLAAGASCQSSRQEPCGYGRVAWKVGGVSAADRG